MIPKINKKSITNSIKQINKVASFTQGATLSGVANKEVNRVLSNKNYQNFVNKEFNKTKQVLSSNKSIGNKIKSIATFSGKTGLKFDDTLSETKQGLALSLALPLGKVTKPVKAFKKLPFKEQLKLPIPPEKFLIKMNPPTPEMIQKFVMDQQREFAKKLAKKQVITATPKITKPKLTKGDPRSITDFISQGLAKADKKTIDSLYRGGETFKPSKLSKLKTTVSLKKKSLLKQKTQGQLAKEKLDLLQGKIKPTKKALAVPLAVPLVRKEQSVFFDPETALKPKPASKPVPALPAIERLPASKPKPNTETITVPDISTPEIPNTPDISTPEITIPEITTPEITIPDISTPEITIPNIDRELTPSAAIDTSTETQLSPSPAIDTSTETQLAPNVNTVVETDIMPQIQQTQQTQTPTQSTSKNGALPLPATPIKPIRPDIPNGNNGFSLNGNGDLKPKRVEWKQGDFYKNVDLQTGKEETTLTPIGAIRGGLTPKDTFTVIETSTRSPRVRRIKLEKNIAIVTSSGINFEPIVQVKQFRFKSSKKNKGKNKLIRSTNFER